MKSFWKSKTMYFGSALIVLGGLQSFLPSLEGFIKPELYGQLVSAIGLVVMLLRTVTNQPLSDK